jgi:O-antigen ligase
MKLFSASDFFDYFSYDDDLLRRIMFLVLLLMPILILVGRSPLDIAASTIAVSFLIHSLYWKNFSWLKAKWVHAAIIFWLFTVLNSLQAHDVNHALSRSVPFVRFPLFAIAVSYWILKSEEDLKIFIYIFAATLLFSTADGLFEFLFGFDFSGRAPLPGRLSGPFEVSTLGIYLTKLGLPMLIAFYAIAPRDNRLLDITWFAFALLVLFIITFSGERMALLLTLFSLFLCACMLKKYRIYFVGTLLLSMIAFSSFVFLNKGFYDRIYMTTIGEIQSDANKSTAYKGQIDAAIDIIGDYPLLGVGADNYRFVCKLPKYDPLATETFSRCLIHPHNVYLETGVGNGLIGILLLGFIFYHWIKLFIIHRPDKTIDALLLSGSLGVLLFIWPFSVGMSIYANFNGIWFWMMVGFALATYQIRTNTPYLK